MSDEPGEPSLARHRCLVLSPRLFDALADSVFFCRGCSEQLTGSPPRRFGPRYWRTARRARWQGADLILHFSEDGSTALCGAGLSASSFYVAVME